MLSGGAGRGGEEPDRRVGHVQGSGHKAQLQRHSEALRQGQAHRGVVLEGRGRAAPRRARRQGGLVRRAHRGGGRQAQLPGVTKKGIHEWLLHRYPGENLAGYNAFTRFMRKNGIAVGLRRPGAAPALRDAARAAAAVRLEGVRQDGQPRRRAVRVQRVRGDAGPFPQARVHPVEDQDDRRPGQVHVRHDREARRRAARVGHGQHVRPGDDQGRKAPQGPARIRVRQGRRLRGSGCAVRAAPQTKGKVESSNRFLSRLMAYQGDFDGWDDIDEIIARIEDASNPVPTRPQGCRRRCCSWRRRTRCRPSATCARPRGGDGRRGARGQGAGHDAGERAHGGSMSVPRRCIGKPARIVCMPGGAMDCYVGGELVAAHVAGGPPTTRPTTPRPWPGSAGSAMPPATSRRPPRPTSGCSTR